MNALLLKIRAVPRGVLVDVALLAASAVCFGFFMHGQVNSQRLSGMGGNPLATVTEGLPERRQANSPVFKVAPPGSKFYNMDSAWTGKLVKASLELDTGTRIELGERTLVTFKRPFKRRLVTRVEEQVKVVKGKAKETASQKEIRAAVEEVRTPELPMVFPSSVPSGAPEKLNIQPGQARILYMKETGEAKVKFAWPDEAAGYLVVRGRESGAVKYVEISPNARFADVTLAQDSAYFWQLIDKDRKLVSGPYRFELRTLTPGAAKELMEQSKRGLVQPIDVFW